MGAQISFSEIKGTVFCFDPLFIDRHKIFLSVFPLCFAIAFCLLATGSKSLDTFAQIQTFLNSDDPLNFDGPWDTLCPGQKGVWNDFSETRCPSQLETCVPNEFSLSKVGCCPFPEARVCPNSAACCPKGTECVLVDGWGLMSLV